MFAIDRNGRKAGQLLEVVADLQALPSIGALAIFSSWCSFLSNCRTLSKVSESVPSWADPVDPDVQANQSLPKDVPTPGTPPAFTTVAPGCCALRSSRVRLAAVTGRYS